ncbi:hypothetical protein EDD29_0838 [Actinocorallia herbida]|uniref:Uncharacterized protein n=1 Tax=Actinocorallia herbida TaxID=58109 RepID=A0A3N1CRL7_9ACTN|nr:hypothetical protein [Actinocorallia herbida]ROO83338.1 hypothetical protein EDD29_0838 [Actinocorallia herbida]
MPDEDLGKALVGSLAEVFGTRRLVVVEMTGAQVSVWKVKRDDAGVPRMRSASFAAESAPDRSAAMVRGLLGRLGVGPADTVLVVARPGGPVPDPGLRVGAVHTMESAAPVREALRTAIADEPLTQMYELVTLRATPRGRLEFGAVPLFPMGTQRGATVRVAVRFTAREETGTTLAVVASSPRERRFRPVVLVRAHTAPAARELRVDLDGPGKVGFPDVPGRIVPESRPWPELVDGLQGRTAPRPAGRTGHLVCAVEAGVPGSGAQVMAERIALLRSLAQTCPPGMRLSLLAYGPHAFQRAADDSVPELLCWAEPVPVFLDRLTDLANRPAATEGYPLAARLECALALVAARLEDGAEETALLAVGSRPAFPPRVHPSQILPCPKRHDWQRLAADLRRRGVRIAAVRDGHDAADFWRTFAPDALFDAAARDQDGVAEALRLPGPGEEYAFPLSETE